MRFLKKISIFFQLNTLNEQFQRFVRLALFLIFLFAYWCFPCGQYFHTYISDSGGDPGGFFNVPHLLSLRGIQLARRQLHGSQRNGQLPGGLFATPNKNLPAFIAKPIFSYVFPAQRNRGQPVIRRHVSRQERHSGHQHSEGSPVLGRVLSSHLLPEEL